MKRGQLAGPHWFWFLTMKVGEANMKLVSGSIKIVGWGFGEIGSCSSIWG